jgi:hypothetical protein
VELLRSSRTWVAKKTLLSGLIVSGLVLGACSVLSDASDISPCDRDQIGEEDGQLIGAYAVEDGELADLCFGAPVDRLEESWQILADIATPAELSPVVVFAGYKSQGEGTGNVAFAGPIGDSNESFVVAVDLDEASKDLDELRVTMAHEFAHVFTQVSAQVDLTTTQNDCTTYWNGSWCFEQDSYLADWVDQFWDRGALNSLPSGGGSDTPGGEQRCSLDSSFLGAYAASHPEEDFAESFAAFVYSIDVPAGVEPRQDFFRRYPELVAYNERANAAGERDLPNNFDRCG